MIVGLEVVDRMLPVCSEDIARIALETLADLKEGGVTIRVSQIKAGLVDNMMDGGRKQYRDPTHVGP